MQINQQELDALVGRLFSDLSAGYGGVMVSIGDKLGLYKVMANAGPLSSAEVAHRAGHADSPVTGETRPHLVEPSRRDGRVAVEQHD